MGTSRNPSQYRAGIIGLGFIGAGDQAAAERLGQRVADLDGTHRGALQNHPRIALVAGSSRDAGRRERFAQATNATVYADYREMLAAERLDLVSIATMTPDHAEQTIGCAQAGVRAVYCEKPMAATLAQAEQMVAACRQAGTKLIINHNRRFVPNYRRLADFIAAGKLGDLTGITIQWPSGRFGNVGTHFIDALRMLTRREVCAVSATLDTAGRPDCRGAEFRDPGGWAFLRMDGGLMTVINAPDYSREPAEIVIAGTLGRAKVAGNTVQIDIAGSPSDHWPTLSDGIKSMDLAVGEIVDALDQDGSVCSSGEEALRDLEIILACHASHARRSAWVDLPLTGSDREIHLNSG